jgi:hypothetical protein
MCGKVGNIRIVVGNGEIRNRCGKEGNIKLFWENVGIIRADVGK